MLLLFGLECLDIWLSDDRAWTEEAFVTRTYNFTSTANS
jgi:hypothetical protein